MKKALALTLFLISISYANAKFQYKETSEILITQGGRISGIWNRNGTDLVIGGLVYVHGNDNGKCSEIINHKSNENLEALLYAIDTINSDPNLLPNLTLGYDIRDTCGSESVGLDEAIDIIHTNGQIEIESCSSESNQNNDTTLNNAPVMAVIGAYTSSVSLSVAGLFRLFKMPQVSYGSTSSLLSNREFYPYFYRTVPPDDHQVQAMIDIILYFKWDHVSTLYSSNRYGQPAIDAFHELSRQNGICLDMIVSLNEFSDYSSIANELYNSSANVVVLFASTFDAEDLLTAVLKVYWASSIKRQFLWIASDSWAELKKYSEITIGKWGTTPFSEYVPGFDDYISQLTPMSNKRNPWFNKLYRHYYNCSYGMNNCNSSIVESSSFVQDSFDALAIDAVYTIANALHDFFMEHCEVPIVWHPQNRSCLKKNNDYAILTGEMLKSYIQNINATSLTENMIHFDSNGNVEGSYKILNYQFNTSSDCRDNCEKLVHVGTWDGSVSSNRLKIFQNFPHQFGIDRVTGKLLTSIQSNCRKCSAGHIKRLVTSSCCGTCDPCLGSKYTSTNFSTESTQCATCPQNMWGNSPLTGSNHCINIDESYLKTSDVWGIILILLSVIGLIGVVFVTFVFVWFWNTPIVKSSGREQMIIVLIGVTLCFLITVVFLVKPSPVACGIQWAGIWVSFSLMLCALFIKLVRIARIFMQKKAASRPKFIAPLYQVAFTFILTAIPIILIVISQTVDPPGIEKELKYNDTGHNAYPKLIVTCKSPHIAAIVLQMMYFSVLLIASNGLAVMTIRFPANFNEAKYVAFATFSLVLTWFFFILSFVVSNDTPYQGAALSTTIQISAMAVLVCLFGPRVFIIIAWPSKNTNISTAWPSKNATISLPEIKFNSQNKAMTTLKNSIIVKE